MSRSRIRRIGNHTPEALALYARHDQAPGKLALLDAGRFYTGDRVWAQTAIAIASSWVPRAWRPA